MPSIVVFSGGGIVVVSVCALLHRDVETRILDAEGDNNYYCMLQQCISPQFYGAGVQCSRFFTVHLFYHKWDEFNCAINYPVNGSLLLINQPATKLLYLCKNLM
jgi:hypothetical protein